MILRRVIDHLKTQNWTAVALDFVIVVMGVFMGIQVSNWNAARTDRQDEDVFLRRLHDDIVRVEESSARLRTRRIALIDDLNAAAKKIFSPGPARILSNAECMSLAVSHYYNISVLGLPSLVELTNAGRVGIIRDKTLGTALVEYQQRTAALSDVIATDQLLINNLIMLNPALIKVAPIFDLALGEFQTAPSCDLDGMRNDQAFLNAVAENLDSYDAYLRDGLLPWNRQLLEVHRLVDEVLDINHKVAAE